jgi:hypothetical protein
LIDKIARSVVDKSIKGGPTTEHEGEENFNMHLVHGTDNEAEMDVEFTTLSVRVLPKYTLVYDIHVQDVPIYAC